MLNKLPYLTLPCLQVAQYIHFAMPVLQAFLDKYQEEEEKEVERIKQKYAMFPFYLYM